MSNARFLLTVSLISTTVAQAAFADGNGNADTAFSAKELKRCEAMHKRQINDELNRVYDKAFPAYFEFCAGSIWAPRGSNISTGGGFGHAFGLIRGACLAKDANGRNLVPNKLVQCPGHTIGFSTNASLRSQQWVANDDRNFVLYGNHDAGQPLDPAAKQSIRDEVLSRGTYDGVVFAFDKPDQARPESELINWIDNDSFGTEFAVAAARGQVTCARVPLTGTNPKDKAKPLQVLLDKLNQLNENAFRKGYSYDGIVNNCVHTPHSAMAALDAWGLINNQTHPESTLEVIKNSNDAIGPFNQVLDTYKLGKEMKRKQIDNMISRLRSDNQLFGRFVENGWYATQVGTMLDNVPTLSYKNYVFDPVNKSPTQLVSLPNIVEGKIKDSSFFGNFLVERARDLKNLAKTIDPTGLLKCSGLDDELKCYLSSANGPAINLIANLSSWNNDYTETLSYLRAKPAQEQDEVVTAVTAYIEAKLGETQELLRNANELTAQIPQAPCTDH